MHKYVRMAVFFPTDILQWGVILVFPCSISMTTDEVEHPLCLPSNGGFLDVVSYNFAIFISTWRSPTRE